MALGRDEPSNSNGQQGIDLISAVTEFHRIRDLNRQIRDPDNDVLQAYTKSGSHVEIELEKLARYLPLHLIAKVMLSNRNEASLEYLLCGIRLLHSLCDFEPRHPKLEQILLDDVRVSDQLLDLIFYLLTSLTRFRQEHQSSSRVFLLHSALVACSLYLLTVCIASQWQDIATVLVAHRKADIFMDAAFAALRVDIKFLQMRLLGQYADFYTALGSNAQGSLYYLCQQCEASLQFLQSLCQQKSFRERLVKEQCGKGGVLLLAKGILSLDISPLYREFPPAIASVSRLKSRMLLILLHLCEAESVSYLDDVASTPQSMDLAKSVASEVLELLKNMVGGPQKLSCSSDENYPTGLLQLNAMRLADILSDDSNFRSYITIQFAEVLTAIVSLPFREFLSCWCSSDLPCCEEDATLEYDSFTSAGCTLDSLPLPEVEDTASFGTLFKPINMPRASYAHQRTSLLVKIIANLHCFVPEICKEEEDLFLNNFIGCLKRVLPKLPTPDSEITGVVKSNLCSLLSHADSLTPQYLNEEDVQLLRVFVVRCKSLIAPAECEVNKPQESNFEVPFCRDKLSQLNISKNLQETQSLGGCSSPPLDKICPDHTNKSGDFKEGTSENSAFQEENQFYVKTNDLDQTDETSWQGKREDLKENERDIQNVETSGSDSSSTRGKTCVDQFHNVDFLNSSDHMKECVSKGGPEEAEKVGTVLGEDKQRRKRKRTLMNDEQINLIESALLKEPDMQRNAASIQSWAEKLSSHGSEVTTSQLKNWLNNRKARLARAAKDFRAPSEGEILFPDKHGGTVTGSHYESAESPADEICNLSRGALAHQSRSGEKAPSTGIISKGEAVLPKGSASASGGYVQCRPGQLVVLIDGQGGEIGKGKVFQVQGKWYGFNLEESQMCIVDVIELKAERRKKLPHPCEPTCTTFDEAEKKLGIMRVLWDSNKLLILPSP